MSETERYEDLTIEELVQEIQDMGDSVDADESVARAIYYSSAAVLSALIEIRDALREIDR